MDSQKSKKLPSPLPPPFHWLRCFKPARLFEGIFSPDRHLGLGTSQKAVDSVDLAQKACLKALTGITKVEAISIKLPVEDRDRLLGSIRKFSYCVDPLLVLCRTTDPVVTEDARLLTISMIYLLCAMLSLQLCFLDKRWMYIRTKEVLKENAWIQQMAQDLWNADIPWDGHPEKVFRRDEVILDPTQRSACQAIISRGCFNDLHVLVSKFDNDRLWNRLVYSKRQAGSVAHGITNITHILEKLTHMCERDKWVGLQFPLPPSLASQESAIRDLSARADFRLGWVNPSVILRVEEWLGEPIKTFEFNLKFPVQSGSWGETGMWFVNDKRYQDWFQSADGASNRHLWCLGGIGIGKSVLSHVVVERHISMFKSTNVRQRPIFVQMHFHEDEGSDICEVFTAILQQIIPQVKSPTDLMVSINERAFVDNPVKRSVPVLFNLLKQLTQIHKIYFFLDGLDECNLTTATDLIGGLMSLGPSHRTICFSRKSSTISQQTYASFSFWSIQAHPSDIEHCIRDAIDTFKYSSTSAMSLESSDINRLVKTAVDQSQGGFLLLSSQLWEFVRFPEKGLGKIMQEVPEGAFDRMSETFYRIQRYSRSSSDILTIIAWVAIKERISVSSDIPHLKPSLSDSSLETIDPVIDDSLGILDITNDDITFSSDLASAYIFTEFPRLFPDFVRTAIEALTLSTTSTETKPLLEALDAFVIRHKQTFGQPINYKRSGEAKYLGHGSTISRVPSVDGD